jgi:ribosomal protein L37AE/L43A
MAKRKQRFPACPQCGSRDLAQVTEKNFECNSCKYIGLPRWFSSEEEYMEFKRELDMRAAEQQKIWGQKVLHRTVPVVVLVNWATAIYFFIFFLLGMLGLFKSETFQWLFLYSSIAVVALGFGVIVRYGKTRIRF